MINGNSASSSNSTRRSTSGRRIFQVTVSFCVLFLTRNDSPLMGWTTVRWDPETEDELFLAQAASLKASYYNYQIAIHRSFASSSSRSHSPLSSIVCTNAARSSIQVLDVLYKRTGSPWYGNMASPSHNLLGVYQRG